MNNVKECEYMFMPILSKKYCELFCTEKEKFEVGRLCLNVYEKLENPLKKLGIKIMLNIYDAVECYVQENREMIYLCMNTMICYLISKSPKICTMVISAKLERDKIWISFYEENKVETNSSDKYYNNSCVIESEDNIDIAMQKAIEYMEKNNFKLEIAKSDCIWKIGIGFPIVKEGV